MTPIHSCLSPTHFRDLVLLRVDLADRLPVEIDGSRGQSARGRDAADVRRRSQAGAAAQSLIDTLLQPLDRGDLDRRRDRGELGLDLRVDLGAGDGDPRADVELQIVENFDALAARQPGQISQDIIFRRVREAGLKVDDAILFAVGQAELPGQPGCPGFVVIRESLLTREAKAAAASSPYLSASFGTAL
ncbi:hypothetical protein FLP41_15075 [Paracoccus marcusii]|uniref:hypothetical protein n=1 Tax=Paracoccus marcusii TaxID=59779 RepID=UPI002ED31F29|nr:hypothetical protein FLP41_15075 [Paracoccus marcusii]